MVFSRNLQIIHLSWDMKPVVNSIYKAKFKFEKTGVKFYLEKNKKTLKKSRFRLRFVESTSLLP